MLDAVWILLPHRLLQGSQDRLHTSYNMEHTRSNHWHGCGFGLDRFKQFYLQFYTHTHIQVYIYIYIYIYIYMCVCVCRPRKTSRKSLGVFARICTFTKYFPEYTTVSCIFWVFCNWEDRSTQRKLTDLYLEVGFELF